MATPITRFSLDTSLFNSTLYSRLCALWFLDLSLPASTATPVQMSRWFGASTSPIERADFDAQCRSIAFEALQSIGPAQLSLPTSTDILADSENYPIIAAPFVRHLDEETDEEKRATEALGMVLLLDQMTRNCFRSNQSHIYSHYDRISRAVSYAIYARGLDKSNVFRDSPPWRSWFYLPMMHSEAMSDHEVLSHNIDEMRSQAKVRADEGAVEYLTNTGNFEKKHLDILAQFGRYPHRNQVLGRQSTIQEKAYLEAGGDTFGT